MNSPQASRQPLDWATWALIGILAIYGVMVLNASLHYSSAADEPAHIRSGMGMLTRYQYVDTEKAWWSRVDLLHPPLDMIPAALAVAGGQSPDFRSQARVAFDAVLLARLFNHAMGGLILILVFIWGRALWGTDGAMLATLLLLLNPLFLGHCAIVSSDLYMAFGGLLAAYALWRVYLAEPKKSLSSWGWRLWFGAAVVGICVAVAIACKVANLMFLAIAPAAAIWGGWLAGRQGERWIFLARSAASAAVACAIALVLALAVYAYPNFEHGPLEIGGLSFRLPIGHALAIHALLALKLGKILSLPFYFFGTIETPEPYNYPAAFLVKMPFGILLLLAAGVVASGWLAWRRRRAGVLFIVVLVVGLPVYFSIQGFYLGLRHMLLPIVLLSLLGGVTVEWTHARTGATKQLALLGVCLLTAWSAIDVARATPWYIGYFNRLGRGSVPPPLVDFDGDWGQGLIALADWQQSHSPDRPIWLAYFGSNRPEDYGIDYRGLLSPYSFLTLDPEFEAGTDPDRIDGWVAISATQLAGTHMGAVKQDRWYYKRWQQIEPAAVVAGSIYIYDRRKTERSDEQ